MLLNDVSNLIYSRLIEELINFIALLMTNLNIIRIGHSVVSFIVHSGHSTKPKWIRIIFPVAKTLSLSFPTSHSPIPIEYVQMNALQDGNGKINTTQRYQQCDFQHDFQDLMDSTIHHRQQSQQEERLKFDHFG